MEGDVGNGPGDSRSLVHGMTVLVAAERVVSKRNDKGWLVTEVRNEIMPLKFCGSREGFWLFRTLSGKTKIFKDMPHWCHVPDGVDI